MMSALRKPHVWSLLAAGVCAMLGLPASAAEQPNVILVMVDDQGYGDLSCHGTPVLKTPHMDRLHGESVRLTDFHVAPMCSPTRGQLMTGRDAMKNGCTAVCRGRSMPRADIPMMANFFKQSGYATGHFGKWHMGDSYPFRPQDRGFEETLHHRAWGITSLADYWGNTYFSPVLNHNGADKKYRGYCTDIFFREAMKWIQRKSESSEPFFLYLATNTPHVPNVCDKKYSEPYRGKHEGKPLPPRFYGMIANLDENLGKLESFLKKKQLRENTILIYLSDNGTQCKEAMQIFNAGMRERKTSVYEGGHRVPCFIRWPDGKLRHGTDVSELTQVQDLLPTLIDLADLNDNGASFDGVSLAGLLDGTRPKLADRKLVIQYDASGEPWDPAVVLWDKWRLVKPGELYDIAQDPHQDHNVARRHPRIARAMEEHYNAWHAESRPLFDMPRWIKVGAKHQDPMMLYAQDWVGDYCDNRGGLLAGTGVGYWNIDVVKEGVYEFELRRWPVEADLPLAAGMGKKREEGRLAIKAANLRLGAKNYTLDSRPKATRVNFRVRLTTGQQRLQTRFLGPNNRPLCSAMYVKVTRLPDSARVKLTPQSERGPVAALSSESGRG